MVCGAPRPTPSLPIRLFLSVALHAGRHSSGDPTRQDVPAWHCRYIIFVGMAFLSDASALDQPTNNSQFLIITLITGNVKISCI